MRRSRSAAVTIKDVAERAGVSIKTVSRVVNGEPHVGEATRARVAAAVRELGFIPNAAARSLSSARSFLIGMFFDDPASGYAVDVQLGALGRCRERGYHLVVEGVDVAASTLAADVRAVVAALRLDGVVLTPPICDDPRIVGGLEEIGAPFVRIAPEGDLDRSPFVVIDDRAAARSMTEHLLDLGHRRVAFVMGDPRHSASRRRYKGYREALEARGVPVDPGLVVEGDFSYRSGVAAAERLLASAPRPTAVFASNDDMALGVLSVAARLGVTAPQQLSVAGFDDSPSARVVWPQLTTIRQPKAEMAAAAIDLLIGAPDLVRDVARRALDFQLMVRGTTGPAPGDGA